MKMTHWMAALLLAVVTGLAGCREQQTESLPTGNAVYYWRTDLRLDSTERAFLRTYDIKKVYCRYFDVVMRDGEPMPNATLTFSDTLPAGVEMVPTVYITEDCMHEPHNGLAEKLVERIRQMNETNDISGVREIQIDCDYTARSRRVYYDFLTAVANCLQRLSSRLGQTSELDGARCSSCSAITTVCLSCGFVRSDDVTQPGT